MSTSLNVTAIIPARYASERLPGKPLADICGKPMVQHVYERTAKASLVRSVVVATDDDRIMAAVKAFGGRAVMTPASLHTGTDRVACAAKSLTDADIVVNVQGDEPLIEPAMIDEAVKPLLADATINVGTVVRKIDNEDDLTNPGIVKVVLDGKGDAIYFSRSPVPFVRDRVPGTWLDLHTFYRHIGLYVFRKEFLPAFARMPISTLERIEKLEQLRIIENGYKIRCTVTMFDSVPVDTENDLERVRSIVVAHERRAAS
jgi:3-deoxy-manno-octulosonate cytidylyltransferase (CMP-KDO synthetase)